MSSTNRGHEREKTDYYVTPTSCINDFLNDWLGDLQNENSYIANRPDKVKWLDPCAGGDIKNKMSYADTIKEWFEPNVLDTIDIREDSRADVKADYLKEKYIGYDVIITNPPFKLALEIIEKALKEVNEDGYVIMLLRLNFLEGRGRRAFFKDNMPERIYVHHRRMSFTDNGQTDSIAYAHFVWKKGRKKNHSLLSII